MMAVMVMTMAGVVRMGDHRAVGERVGVGINPAIPHLVGAGLRASAFLTHKLLSYEISSAASSISRPCRNWPLGRWQRGHSY